MMGLFEHLCFKCNHLVFPFFVCAGACRVSGLLGYHLLWFVRLVNECGLAPTENGSRAFQKTANKCCR